MFVKEQSIPNTTTRESFSSSTRRSRPKFSRPARTTVKPVQGQGVSRTQGQSNVVVVNSQQTLKNVQGAIAGLKICPLGGQEEVGRNCTVFEYENDIIILDMGMQFADEDMPGVDYIIPNVSSLRGKEKNIRGVIFSHGHLDHIGAAPILLEQLGNPPIVGMKLTLAMIKHRQEDYKRGTTKSLKTITINNVNQKN